MLLLELRYYYIIYAASRWVTTACDLSLSATCMVNKADVNT